MKKYFAKVLSSLLAMAFIAISAVALPAVPAKAAGSTVTVYFQNSLNWKQVYCYTWYGSGSTGKGWPGALMTDAGNGWVKITYTGSKPLNVIFNDNGKPTTTQTANHTPADLALSKSEYWFTIASGTSKNSGGMGGGANLTVNTTAKAGWPTLAAATKTTETTTVTGTGKVTAPKTGDNNMVTTASIVALLSLAGLTAAITKRKNKN